MGFGFRVLTKAPGIWVMYGGPLLLERLMLDRSALCR